ncbi:MAG: signal peptidase II [Azospirillum brasilense]|nr:MAG: signal peptidase II [Azospirillum brasilense]
MTHSPTRSRALHMAGVALLVIVLDQLSKWYMLSVLDIGHRPPMEVTSFFRLVLVWNNGVSFGMLQHEASFMPWFLIAVAVVISVVLTRLGLKSALKLERVGYGMVIGGALGNVIDRVRFRAVVDFLHFHLGSFSWPAFNVADAAICLGVGVLLLMMMKHPAKP